jgi:hypothetical protein
LQHFHLPGLMYYEAAVALSAVSCDRAKKARNDKKLQRQQERAATGAEGGTPEPTVENEPRET